MKLDFPKYKRVDKDEDQFQHKLPIKFCIKNVSCHPTSHFEIYISMSTKDPSSDDHDFKI